MTSRENYRLRRMAGLVSDCRIVLDIGYAQSPNQFLQNERVIGVDLHADVRPPNYSDAVTADATRISDVFRNLSIDAITAGEFLEHLEDPFGFLRECHKALRPKGRVVISTPNPNSPLEQLLTIWLSRKYFYTNEHLFSFPQRWLIRALELTGFNHVELKSGGFPMPFLGLVPAPRPWCYQTIAVGTKP